MTLESQVTVADNPKAITRVVSSALLGGWTLIETFVVTTIIVLLAATIWTGRYYVTVQLPESYRAWVKQTGNPKNLTYDEWRAFMRSQDNAQIVPVIIPISH
jgi:hypothetical protein